MKTFIKKTSQILIIAFALMYIPTTVFAKNTDTVIEINKDDFIGGWDYAIEGAPEGYESGFLMIVKQGDEFKVQIQLSSGSLDAEDVEVKGNKMNFKVMINGEAVDVALQVRKSILSGTVTSPSSGIMSLAGTKSLSPE